MNKIIWISTITISLFISIILNFKAKSLNNFFIGLLILGFSIFGILTLIIKSIQNIKQKNIEKTIVFGILSIVTITIFYFGYLVFSSGGICLTAITQAHFRTNIFTGQCDFGGYSSCVTSDPWYYKSGCNISNQEKISILKNTEWYNEVIEKCNIRCQRGSSEIFCKDSYFRIGISCKDLISCDTISCD